MNYFLYGPLLSHTHEMQWIIILFPNSAHQPKRVCQQVEKYITNPNYIYIFIDYDFLSDVMQISITLLSSD